LTAEENGGDVRLFIRSSQHLMPDGTSGEEAAAQIRWRLSLELYHRQAGDHLEVSNVERDQVVAQVQCCRADQQVFEGDVDSMSRLFALDATSKLRDFHGHWKHHHVAAEFFAKGLPLLAIRCALGPVNTVG
jgi:hypothetical protein